MKHDVNYLAAKLELIHEDVKQLQTHVDRLRQESTSRRAVGRVLLIALTVMGATVGWLVDNALSVANKIELRLPTDGRS